MAFLGQGFNALARRAGRTPGSFLWAEAACSYLPRCKSRHPMTDERDPGRGRVWETSSGLGAMSSSRESWPSLRSCAILSLSPGRQPTTDYLEISVPPLGSRPISSRPRCCFLIYKMRLCFTRLLGRLMKIGLSR